MEKRRILITGGTGLVGSHLVPLLRDEAEIHLVGGTRGSVSGVTFHPADLAAGLDTASLPGSIDTVIHLAQSREFRNFPGSAIHVARLNAFAPVELARYAVQAGASRFIYASTGGVYARADAPLTESAPIAADSDMDFYAATKRAGERMLGPFGDNFALIVLRPFFIYGRGQDESMLIPRLIEKVRAGAPIRLLGQNGIKINPTHASDAAAAVRAALNLEGRQFVNIAGPDILSLREIAEAIGRALDRDPHFIEEPAGSGGNLVGATQRMASVLIPPSMSFLPGVLDSL